MTDKIPVWNGKMATFEHHLELLNAYAIAKCNLSGIPQDKQADNYKLISLLLLSAPEAVQHEIREFKKEFAEDGKEFAKVIAHLKKKFTKSNEDQLADAFGEIVVFKQDETTADPQKYLNKFEKLMQTIKDIDPTADLKAFAKGKFAIYLLRRGLSDKNLQRIVSATAKTYDDTYTQIMALMDQTETKPRVGFQRNPGAYAADTGKQDEANAYASERNPSWTKQCYEKGACFHCGSTEHFAVGCKQKNGPGPNGKAKAKEAVRR